MRLAVLSNAEELRAIREQVATSGWAFRTLLYLYSRISMMKRS